HSAALFAPPPPRVHTTAVKAQSSSVYLQKRLRGLVRCGRIRADFPGCRRGTRDGNGSRNRLLSDSLRARAGPGDRLPPTALFFPARLFMSDFRPVRSALRVLVVDGSRDEADALAILVGLWGYDPLAAYCATAALGAALAGRPDVILLDLAVPGMDGCEVARQLR